MKSVPEIRNQLRAARRAVDAETRLANGSMVCDKVLQLDSFKKADRIAAYLAFDGEVDPMPLMVAAVEQGKQVYLPVIDGKSKPLSFAAWTPTTEQVANRFKILEPQVPRSEHLTGQNLDLVICPLVGFDQTRNRIGVGGGFYDRTFEFLNDPQNGRAVQLVGVAFELQKLESIEPQTWDVKLDAVVTEAAIY